MTVRFNPTSHVSFQAKQKVDYKQERGRAQNSAFVDSVKDWEGKKGGFVKKSFFTLAVAALAAVVLHKVPAKAIPKNKVGNVIRGAKLHLEKFIQKYLPKAKEVANQAVDKGKEVVNKGKEVAGDLVNKGKDVVSKT